jgi:hypothetical protein
MTLHRPTIHGSWILVHMHPTWALLASQHTPCVPDCFWLFHILRLVCNMRDALETTYRFVH